MNHWECTLAGLLVVVFAATCSRACDWDTETLLEERSRFPTALEIILGKFPRHTLAYYEWRLKDRLEKLESDPENDLMLDDVAVSLEKLKRYDEGIAVVRKQLERNPDRYESLANLGTIYIHDGQLTEGLKWIERAIEVNPDAHFGREKYQVILVKYVLSCTTDDGLKLPLGRGRLQEDHDYPLHAKRTFYTFLRNELHGDPNKFLSTEELQEATKGILGMMRFSQHKSPILLEALGDLQQAHSADQLAFRAYSSAAQNVQDEAAKRDYNALASRAISWSLQSLNQGARVEVSEKLVAEDFRKEQADANAWFAKLAEDERKWIAAGEAVDLKFNEKYRAIPEAVVTDRSADEDAYVYRDPAKDTFILYATLCGLLVITACAVLALFLKRVVRCHRQDALPESNR
ncbi:Tetratricopeptide repeat protein [Stieleria neptunia]|uniref:Tetratricopeptide repeat protein n=1 Tax=Stieleria neptunia TaxID=2527979 RepID=A0A518HWR9_9BACT|nr:hypothetical protein [Stieleria neptunia]QDV45283.1 Tetratricopeptide repeat protein [Stieleria neptunia]